jgi:Tfp pilus assembly protein PilN
MRRLTRAVAHDPVPTVNLLSPWVFDAIATGRLRLRFIAAGAVLVLLIGVGWAVQYTRIDRTEQALGVEQAQTSRLSAHTKELATVQTYATAVDRQKVLARLAMKREVYLSRALAGLLQATPRGAVVDTIDVTVSAVGAEAAAGAVPVDGAELSTCPGADPFNTRVVAGCMTLSGTAQSRASVSELVVNLGDDPRFVEPFISTTTTAEGDDLAFTGSVGLSTRTFTRRYSRIDALLARTSR